MKTNWLVYGARCLERLMFPPLCLVCGLTALAGDLCGGCAGDFPANRSCCTRCGLPLALPVALCGHCLQRPPPFERAYIPFRYGPPLDGLVTRFKFGANLAAGRVLAEQWLACEPRAPELAGHVVVPVPLHRNRLRQRGFNQSLELAKRIARTLALPLARDALERRRDTVAQSELGAAERRRNVLGAFAASSDVTGRRVALVDDVVTTGATAVACAIALRRAGAQAVTLVAMARADAGSGSEPRRDVVSDAVRHRIA